MREKTVNKMAVLPRTKFKINCLLSIFDEIDFIWLTSRSMKT